jgi:predicted Zn-dependent peptidase
MDDDNPDYLVHEIFTQNFWKGHPLGKPILGTKETVERLEQAKLFGYYGDRFRGGNVVFTAAGNLDHQRFVDEVRRRFESMPAGVPQDASQPPTATARIILRNKK